MTPAELAATVREVALEVLAARDLDTTVVPDALSVERPRNPEHGDYATTVALQTAKRVGLAPRDLAQALADALAEREGIDFADIAGPGFVNIRLASDAQGKIVSTILDAGAAWGTGNDYASRRVNLEFVSANPTGPIHLGGTRWAAVGDALGRVLAARGFAVTREYYFNDHGSQIDRYTESLVAAATGQPTPESGYAGAYIKDIAATIVERHPGVLEASADERNEIFRAEGTSLIFEHIKQTLHEFRTDFDVYFHENSLFDSGEVDAAVERLKSSGSLYEADGAWWLRSTDHGDDKDRVVIKSDGNSAYIAGDIAYIKNKIDRGHDLCIYMLGADHHGYIARLKAAAGALGYDPNQIEVLIGQMVNLVRDGERVKMSKRAGTVITLDDLVEAIGVDAARYAMVRQSVDSTLDIDLELWASSTSENPVFYVQYAHARLCSLQRTADTLGISASTDHLGLLAHDREGTLIRCLGEYPDIVATAAELREPHRIARYLERLAGDYHRFYDSCQVLPKASDIEGGAADPESDLHAARLALCTATRQTLANGLELLGVSAPERM